MTCAAVPLKMGEEYSGIALAALRWAASRGDDTAKTKIEVYESKNKSSAKRKNNEAIENVKKCSNEWNDKTNRIKPEITKTYPNDPVSLLWTRIRDEPTCFEAYTLLIKALKTQRGRERELRTAYEMILSEYPLCYGYWHKLAILEGNTWDQTQQIFKNGLEVLACNPHLWTCYLEEIIEKSNMDVGDIRAIQDEALNQCGLHWNSYPVWNMCIEFEETNLIDVGRSEFLDHKERDKLLFTIIQRIRELYYRALSTPILKLSTIWNKFKLLIGHGKCGNNRGGGGGARNAGSVISLDITDLIVEEELIPFQTFVMETYGDQETVYLNSAPLKEKTDAVIIQELRPIASEGREDTAPASFITIKVVYLDNSKCTLKVLPDTTIEQLLAAAKEKTNYIYNSKRSSLDMNNSGGAFPLSSSSSSLLSMTSMDLIFNNKILPINSTVGKSGIENNAQLHLFDGKTITKLVSVAIWKAIENWFLKYRENLYNKTMKEQAVLGEFEDRIKRNYFHPLHLSKDQLDVWRSYLDFEENRDSCLPVCHRASSTSKARLDMLYERVLEACCYYPEFWHRYANLLEARNQIDMVHHTYQLAITRFLKQRPDIRFLYAGFVEKCGDFEKAKQIISEVIDEEKGMAPGLLEGYIRLLNIHKRKKEYDECINLLDFCINNIYKHDSESAHLEKDDDEQKENRDSKKSNNNIENSNINSENRNRCNIRDRHNNNDLTRIIMEKAYFLVNTYGNVDSALEILRDEWERNRGSISLLKYYLALLKRKYPMEQERLKEVYQQAIHPTTQLSLGNQWLVWRDYLFFLEREEVDVNFIDKTKNDFNTFLQNNRSGLDKCRRRRYPDIDGDGTIGTSKGGKKVKINNEIQKYSAGQLASYVYENQQYTIRMANPYNQQL